MALPQAPTQTASRRPPHPARRTVVGGEPAPSLAPAAEQLHRACAEHTVSGLPVKFMGERTCERRRGGAAPTDF